MKFIRKYIKNIIKEAICENFPPLNISITERKADDYKLYLLGGTFVNSKIIFRKEQEGKAIHMEQCIVENKADSFIDIKDKEI